MTLLPDLRYPIGKMNKRDSFSMEELAAATDTLAALPAQLTLAVEGLKEAQLDTPYRPDGWSIRQLVHHIADSHASAYLAVREALSADWPLVQAYDADAWAGLPHAVTGPVGDSLQIIAGVHGRLVATLRSVAGPDWMARGYLHSEGGRCALERVPPMYAWHSRHHLAHIVHCRQRQGW